MIYIQGPIGSGKTSLARLLSADLKTHCYLEDPGKIPGLKNFYNNGKISRELQSFVVQIEFLSFRYQQHLDGLYRQQEGERNIIYDSSLDSDSLMAKNLYNRGEFPEQLYKDYVKLNQVMQTNIGGHPFHGPDMVIFLDLPFELMLKHISKRGRKMETTDQKLIEYYKSVWDIYQAWYLTHGSTPVIRVDLGKYDYVNSKNDLKIVLNQIESSMQEYGLLNDFELSQLIAKHNHHLPTLDEAKEG